MTYRPILPPLLADAVVVSTLNLIDAQTGELQPPAEDYDPGLRENAPGDEELFTCAACQGNGEVPTERDYWGNCDSVECLTCHGSGEVLAKASYRS